MTNMMCAHCLETPDRVVRHLESPDGCERLTVSPLGEHGEVMLRRERFAQGDELDRMFFLISSIELEPVLGVLMEAADELKCRQDGPPRDYLPLERDLTVGTCLNCAAQGEGYLTFRGVYCRECLLWA